MLTVKDRSTYQPQPSNVTRTYPKPDLYSSSLEANITSGAKAFGITKPTSKVDSPIHITQGAKGMNNQSPKTATPPKSRIEKTVEPPKNTTDKKDDYDESKNPFADDEQDEANDSDDALNPFKDDMDDEF